MSDPEIPNRLEFGRRYRRLLLGVTVAGAFVQLLLGVYFLSIVHEPKPHDVPVGVVGAGPASVVAQLETGHHFRVTSYPTAAALSTAITHRRVYGGFDLESTSPTLYVASAAGSLPAGLLKATYTKIIESQRAAQVAALSPSVPVATVRALTASPAVVDVVPLPTADSNGATISSVIQVLALGGSIASLGLGRLIPRVQRSLRRGVGHVFTLLFYAAVSGGLALVLTHSFGITAGANHARLFLDYGLVSLAVAGSTAGLVAVFGPVGALSGALYFLIGSTISGAALPWQFLTPFWRVVGECLPTGAGVYVLRSSYYFPHAGGGSAYLTLGLYAGLGVLFVLITNTVPNRGDDVSALDVDLVGAVAGAPHGRHV